MAPADGLGRARRADPDEARLPPRFGDLETLQVTKVPDLAGPIAGSGCGLVTKPTSRQMTAAGWPTPAKPWTVDHERARSKPHRRPGGCSALRHHCAAFPIDRPANLRTDRPTQCGVDRRTWCQSAGDAGHK